MGTSLPRGGEAVSREAAVALALACGPSASLSTVLQRVDALKPGVPGAVLVVPFGGRALSTEGLARLAKKVAARNRSLVANVKVDNEACLESLRPFNGLREVWLSPGESPDRQRFGRLERVSRELIERGVKIAWLVPARLAEAEARTTARIRLQAE